MTEEIIDPIDESNDGNEPLEPVTPVVTTGSITITGNEEHVDFRNMTAREKTLVEKARRQEKQKLHKELKEAEERLRELTNTNMANTPTTNNGGNTSDSDVLALREEIRQMRVEQLEREKREAERALRADLLRYRSERLLEMNREGRNVIESLVDGDSEEEIEQAIKVAEAEYSFVEARARKKLEAEFAERNPPPAPVQSYTVPNPNGRPTGVAPINSGSGTVVMENSMSPEFLNEITSNDAVRDGTYEKNRPVALAAIRRNSRYKGNS